VTVALPIFARECRDEIHGDGMLSASVRSCKDIRMSRGSCQNVVAQTAAKSVIPDDAGKSLLHAFTLFPLLNILL
jgi:hypothetical protein